MEKKELSSLKDPKKLEAIKHGKRQVVEGSLTLWNARMEALAEMGNNEDFINHLGTAVDDNMLSNVCGCGPKSPICNCKKCGDSGIFDNTIYEMSQKINKISKELSAIKGKVK